LILQLKIVEMDKQVAHIILNPLQNVLIDKGQLIKNQNEFKKQLSDVIERINTVSNEVIDWRRVESKINIITSEEDKRRSDV